MTPCLEALEARHLPGWFGPGLTWSIVPDGTEWSGGRSNLVAEMARKDANWRDDLRRALEAWGAAIGLMITQVPDGGQPIGANGPQGQIRIGGVAAGPTSLGWAYYPGPSNIAGDVTFNTAQDWSKVDLYSVALHEFGHAVADLDHGASPVMSAIYQGILDGLDIADIAAAQARARVAYSPAMVLSKQGAFA